MADLGAGNCPFRYPSDPLMFIAWRDFIAWAFAEQGFRDAFTADTGKTFATPPRNGLEAMIDAACGAADREAETAFAFIEWLNETQWGADEVSVHPLPSSDPASLPHA